jgi:hypothetical protein
MSEWEGIDYLGTRLGHDPVAKWPTNEARYEKVLQRVRNICRSKLTVTQKVQAIQTFAIPTLDYLLQTGNLLDDTMTKIDDITQCIINDTLEGPVDSPSLLHAAWEDGGMGIRRLETRRGSFMLKTIILLLTNRDQQLK